MEKVLFRHGLLQELCGLPSHLQSTVLASAQIPLLLKVALLPGPLQHAALLAAHPTITSHASLTVPPIPLQGKYVQAFWKAVGKVTELRELSYSCSYFRGGCIPDAALQAISKLSHLTALTVTSFHSHSLDEELLASALRQLSSLQALNLSNNGIKGYDVAALASAIAKLTALRRIDVSRNQLLDAGVQILAAALPQLPHFQSLELDEVRVGDEGCAELGKQLSRCSQLTELIFGDNEGAEQLLCHLCTSPQPPSSQPSSQRSSPQPSSSESSSQASCSPPLAAQCLQHLHLSSDAFSGHITHYLQDLTSLRVLKITRCCDEGYLDESILDCLPRCIASLKNLQELHLVGCGLEDDDVIHLVRHIRNLKHLHTLNLSENSIRGGCSPALAWFVSGLPYIREIDISGNFWPACEVSECFKITGPDHITALQKLNLSNLSILPCDAEALSDTLLVLTNLRTLHLGHNGLQDEGAQEISASFHHLPFLEILNLEKNLFTSEGIEFLAQTIGYLTALQSLSLGHNEVGSQGMAALAPELEYLVHLTELELQGCGLGSHGAAALAKHLSCLNSLHKLNLDSSELGSLGAQSLAPAIGKLMCLRTLLMSENELQCAGIECLAWHMPNLVSLQHLDVTRNGIEDEGAAAFANCLTKVTALCKVKIFENRFDDSCPLLKCAASHCDYSACVVAVEGCDIPW